MELINYISIIAVPFVIFFIVTYGALEKIKVFDSFLEGAKEGIETVIKIFPTLVALFLAVSALRNSGILDLFGNLFAPLLKLLKIPSEILPLMLDRPISGSASTAVALDIMKNYGVDSIIRSYIIYNYGVYRNYFIYYCNLHKLCWCKKYSFCSYCSSCCWYRPECLLLSLFVLLCREVFLDFLVLLKYHNIVILFNLFY